MLRQKNTMGITALIFTLCLVTGSLVAETLLERARMDSHPIFLTGAEEKSPFLSISKNRSLETLHRMQFETADGASVWDTQSETELFKISYDGKNGNTVVKSSTSDNVIAPGTGNDYHFTLKNRERHTVSYSMWMEAKTEPESLELPLKVRVSDSNGWILGDENSWGNPMDLNQVKDGGRLIRGGQNGYTLSWQWPYEQGTDELDTVLGSRAELEDLKFTVTIYTQATVISGSSSSTGTGSSSGRRETVTAETEITPQTQETTAAAAETTVTADETAASRKTQDENVSGLAGENAEKNTADGDNPDRAEEGKTSGETIADETNADNRAETENENPAVGRETGKGISGGMLAAAASGTSLLGLLILLLLWPRGIYLTGFAEEAHGGHVNWKRKTDRIRPDGRFAFRHAPYGKHTWKIVSPDGSEKAFTWRLKRGNHIDGIGFETENGMPVVVAGRGTRAVELYLDTAHGDIRIDTVRWASVDGSNNVYTPGKVEAPKEDGTNLTPGGLKVDENRKFSFEESERQ